ncbi:MAG: hypothetical protein Q4Q20_06290, partial [Methanocorpusculum sp.]|nr:hypothetical protein [Methanocorpusculum sp.]
MEFPQLSFFEEQKGQVSRIVNTFYKWLSIQKIKKKKFTVPFSERNLTGIHGLCGTGHYRYLSGDGNIKR